MAAESEFPHLILAFRGAHEPRFKGWRGNDKEVEANRKDPQAHGKKIRRKLGDMRHYDAELRRLRAAQGLPAIPADKGFLLRFPEGADVEQIVRALGVELVAESEEGLMLVSSEDLEFTKLEEVLQKFETGVEGGGYGSALLDIYDRPDDKRRLENILASEILEQWPLNDATVYIFDLGIQTATSTRDVRWPRVPRRKNESDAGFQARRVQKRREAWIEKEEEWQNNAEARVGELKAFVDHYEGEFLSGIVSDPSEETAKGVVFADSVQVRLRMSGAGFRDVILNFAHLFEVTFPPELQSEASELQVPRHTSAPEIRAPRHEAPAVCVIDSGIQEAHKWLEPAIDMPTSRCFLPGADPTDVADYVSPRGHGTGVAGAVIYPATIPTSGVVNPVAWIQNARVLDNDCRLPDRLLPERYLREVVEHFRAEPRFTKLFNHSINADVPCQRRRMSAWAAKLDELSHERDVLFIQSAGNQTRLDQGDHPNPGLAKHLADGREPPAHQLEDSMRISNPAQSLHALTVGSVSAATWANEDSRSFADGKHRPSGFARAGYGQPWSVVKPEVIEIGGDLVYSQPPPIVSPHPDLAIEVLNSTLHGAPAHSRDGIGTSFTAPKVAHIAAHLQALYPDASPLLYRALIAQSARWPAWAEAEPNKDRVLRWIGFGLPSLDRASANTETRVTLVTPNAKLLPSQQLHLYTVRIPEELRNAAQEARIRIDITLAYTALPRRTRARRTGYLETWLDWEASHLGEPADEFLTRMQEGGQSSRKNFRWTLHTREDRGEAQETTRGRGTLQKDWAIFDSYDLPREFSIAVRAHKGWNHLAGGGSARYCLAVSFEAIETELPLYALVEAENRVEIESAVEVIH